ncbi:MAG: DNA cytosine methyltransferase [Prevotella sp.]|nr:DNA cytosine methyltransferase [Prevotella sp.]
MTDPKHTNHPSSIPLNLSGEDDVPVNRWDKSVEVEENSYYWKGEPIMHKGNLTPNGQPTVVELFCGCGGTSLGFEMAGYQILLGADILAPAIASFGKNHTGVSTILGDIHKVTVEQMKALLGNTPVDVLIGGVPCQGFSLNNRKRHAGDKRNKLYLEFIRFVKALRPKAVVLENVSGMKSTGNIVETIERDLSEASGMTVRSQFLYAPDYGVPQSRLRLLFVGVREKEFDFSSIKKTHGPDTGRAYNTVGDALSDLPHLKANEKATSYDQEPQNDYQRLMREGIVANRLTNHQAPNHPADVIANIARTKQGEPLYERYHQRIRLSLSDLSPTQVSGGIRPSFQFGHPTDARGLTIRERCRLQSFPDRFEVSGGIVQGRVQTGNAVPPLLARAVALAIKQYL